MSTDGAEDSWTANRTTFQRVYDVIVGARDPLTAVALSDRAKCSETAARSAVEQLHEMGIAERLDGRPARYRRNEAYLRWKRVQSLVREHDVGELRDRLRDLMAEDGRYQDRYGVPEPDAVLTDDLPADDHAAVFDRWEDLGDWRTVRRDIRLLRRAVDRARTRGDEAARA